MNVPSKAFYPNLSRLLGAKNAAYVHKCLKNKKIKKFPSFFICEDSELIYQNKEVLRRQESTCAAGFALLNLPKGKSLGRSKPATSSYAQALATHCVGFLLYPSSAELPYAK